MDHETLVRFTFDLFDVDRSGELTIEEFKVLFKEVKGGELKSGRLKHFVKYMDGNNDGLVDFTEFSRSAASS